jgi:hypothetical protein
MNDVVSIKTCPRGGICTSAEYCEQLGQEGTDALSQAGLGNYPETTIPKTVVDVLRTSSAAGCVIEVAVTLDKFLVGAEPSVEKPYPGPDYREFQMADVALRCMLEQSDHLMPNPNLVRN